MSLNDRPHLVHHVTTTAVATRSSRSTTRTMQSYRTGGLRYARDGCRAAAGRHGGREDAGQASAAARERARVFVSRTYRGVVDRRFDAAVRRRSRMRWT